MSDPLPPAVVTALAQQAAESPAHLDPVLVHQVCQEWQIGQQAASLQRCIVEAAYQDKLKAEQQRDAALAERSEWEEKWAAANAYSDTLIEAKNRAQMERDASGAHLRETILELRTANDYANSQSRAAGILAAKVEELANALQTALAERDRAERNEREYRAACEMSIGALRDSRERWEQRTVLAEAERDALRDAPAPTCRVCVVPVLDDAEVACTDCLDTLTAERDALREQLRLSNIDQCNAEAELSMQQQFTTSAESAFIACKAALTEARRVLRAQDECMVCKAELFRDLTVPHCFDCVVEDEHAEEWDAICAAKAAVLAQEVQP